ncbi:MAG: response regulator [Desulfotignum sp.]|nr:response regulator [Desulfotignum sp.]
MKHILIIDDDPQFRQMLKDILEDAGYEITTAANGVEGCLLYRKNPCGLVMTDIFMPEREGLETIRELKNEFPDVKIIAMSGGGRVVNTDFLKVARMMGANDIMKKPVEIDHLLRVVSQLLQAVPC